MVLGLDTEVLEDGVGPEALHVILQRASAPHRMYRVVVIVCIPSSRPGRGESGSGVRILHYKLPPSSQGPLRNAPGPPLADMASSPMKKSRSSVPLLALRLLLGPAPPVRKEGLFATAGRPDPVPPPAAPFVAIAVGKTNDGESLPAKPAIYVRSSGESSGVTGSIPSFEKPVPLRRTRLASGRSTGTWRCGVPAYLSMTTAGVWLAIVSRCVEAGSEGVCSSEQEGCRGFGASGRPRCFQVEDEAASLEVTLVVIGGSASPTSNACPSSRRYPGQLLLLHNHVEMRPKLPKLDQAKRMQASLVTVCRLVEDLAYRR